MKSSEIRELTNIELKNLLEEKREELFFIKMKAKTGELDNKSLIRVLRRDIARILTIIDEKEKVAK